MELLVTLHILAFQVIIIIIVLLEAPHISPILALLTTIAPPQVALLQIFVVQVIIAKLVPVITIQVIPVQQHHIVTLVQVTMCWGIVLCRLLLSCWNIYT